MIALTDAEREALFTAGYHHALLNEVDRLTTALAQVTAGALEADGSAGTLTGNLAVDMAAYATRLKARAEKAEADLRVLREVADLCARVIDVHAEVVMDTAEDRDLHARAVETFRAALRALLGESS